MVDELCALKDSDLEKLLEKYGRSDLRGAGYAGGGGGAVVGGLVGGPVGAGVGFVLGSLIGAVGGGGCSDKRCAKVREAVSSKSKNDLPDGFCIWAEEQKKKNEWLVFSDGAGGGK